MASGAHVERDVAYGPAPEQRLDLHLPAAEPAATVVVVHGGGWSLGDKARPGVADGKAAHWLPRGIAVASVNYRMLPDAGVLQQVDDLARAIAFLQRRAERSQGEQRLVLLGHSSGAHLAALLAADPSLGEAHEVKPWLGTILLDSAALDAVELMRRPPSPLHERAFGREPAGWAVLSPLHRLRARPSPMLLVHSDRRRDAVATARRFAEAVVGRGGRAEVLELPLSHAELNARLGIDASYTERVDAFLQSVGVP